MNTQEQDKTRTRRLRGSAEAIERAVAIAATLTLLGALVMAVLCPAATTAPAMIAVGG